MSNDIIVIGGCKGGVGKSLLSMATVDYFESRKNGVLLVETDHSNPDVGRIYQIETEDDQQVRVEIINLDDADGWIDFVNILDNEVNAKRTVIVNTGARNSDAIANFGENLTSQLKGLKRKLKTLWIINDQLDSISLLIEYIKAMGEVELHVFRNLFFGKENKFDIYNGSKTKQTIEEKGGKSLNFPVLSSRVTRHLYVEKMSISKALEKIPMGNKGELERWRRGVTVLLDEVTKVKKAEK